MTRRARVASFAAVRSVVELFITCCCRVVYNVMTRRASVASFAAVRSVVELFITS